MADVKALKREMAEEKGLRLNLQEEITTLKEELIQAREKDICEEHFIIENETSPIAFSVASHSGFGPVTMVTKVPFPVENVNIGGGWKPGIDAFQAPIAGYFYFFASTASNFTIPRTAIVHTDSATDHTIASMISGGPARVGDANAAILYLQEGDYVTVQLQPDFDGIITSEVNYVYTTFSGFLLFE